MTLFFSEKNMLTSDTKTFSEHSFKYFFLVNSLSTLIGAPCCLPNRHQFSLPVL